MVIFEPGVKYSSSTFSQHTSYNKGRRYYILKSQAIVYIRNEQHQHRDVSDLEVCYCLTSEQNRRK